jgi:hypothetical protein
VPMQHDKDHASRIQKMRRRWPGRRALRAERCASPHWQLGAERGIARNPRRLSSLIAVAAVWTCWAALLPASASADAAPTKEWPRQLFMVAGTRSDQSVPLQYRFVGEIAEASDGGILLGTGTQGAVYVRELTPDGQLRTLDRSIPPFAFGPSPSVGIAAEPDGGTLVLEGYTSQLVRVPPSGDPVVLAGTTGQPGFSGDGGPAVSAELNVGGERLAGVVHTADGGIVFTDGFNNRLRRIQSDGVIQTIAGAGPSGSSPLPCRLPTGDGGAATAATLCDPSDVIATRDGGLAVADPGHNRIRRIAPDGTITTIAGGGSLYWGAGRVIVGGRLNHVEGKPATKVRLDSPTSVAQLANGDIAFNSDHARIARVASDGSFHIVLDSVRDFAGRTPGRGFGLGGIAATREGGLLFAAGDPYYLAPRHSQRTLVGIRDARVTDREVTVYVDATRPSQASVEVSRGERTLAQSTRNIGTGRQRLQVHGQFAPRPHNVQVTLRSENGTTAQDELRLYTSQTLKMRYARRLLPTAVEVDELGPLLGCRRVSGRRIDCAFTGTSCFVVALTLRSTGVIWTRYYHCTNPEHAFQRKTYYDATEPEPIGAPNA